jgi:two-component system chemotaxis response regulator CheB
MSDSVRVLVVDDSAMVRNVLVEGLGADPGIEVVGAAPDPYAARDLIVRQKPDVMTLDVEMPRMDGVEFLRRLMPQWPLPVVMVSALTERGKAVTLDALEAGAVDFVTKPRADVARGLEEMILQLRAQVKVAATANVSYWKHRRPEPVGPKQVRALEESTDKIVAIGASTGGTEAIRTVLEAFPPNAPGTVVVQHMPPGFTKLFAERLNRLCAVEVREAADKDRVMPGRALVAPGGVQLRVERCGGIYRVRLGEADLVNGHAPSVGVLFDSVAHHVGPNAVGMVLTGMGADGADGLKAMRDAGARTLAQDEATSVVYGMPKEAHRRGGAEQMVPLPEMARMALDAVAEGQR